MTLLGVPDFSIGSSTAAPATGTGVDMSLDDMIKNRRSQRPRRAAAAAAANKPAARARAAATAVGRAKAKREAKVNFRRGRTNTDQPSPMDIEREVYRQTRQQTAKTKKTAPAGGKRPAKRAADIKVKAKLTQQRKQKQQNVAPPAWVGGVRRPPSKKAVQAAVDAMQSKGFKMPEGMQMVISFAPAPNADPTKKGKQQQAGQKNKGGGGGGGEGGKGKASTRRNARGKKN